MERLETYNAVMLCIGILVCIYVWVSPTHNIIIGAVGVIFVIMSYMLNQIVKELYEEIEAVSRRVDFLERTNR